VTFRPRPGLWIGLAVPALAAVVLVLYVPKGPGPARLLRPGIRIVGRMRAGELREYRIPLEQGQFLHAVVEQRDIDVIVAMYDALGRELIRVDRPNGFRGPEPVYAVADRTGDWRIEVRAVKEISKGGGYAVTLDTPRTATERDRTLVAAALALSEGDRLRERTTQEARLQALRAYEVALPLWSVLGDHEGRGATLSGMGQIHFALGDLAQAKSAYCWALREFAAEDNLISQRMMLDRYGEVCIRAGDLKGALAAFERALELSRNAAYGPGEANALNDIASVYLAWGEIQPALDRYEQAQKRWHQLGGRLQEASVLRHTGDVLLQAGRASQAMAAFQNALQIEKREGDLKEVATTLISIGTASQDLGRFNSARRTLRQALILARRIGAPDLQSVALVRLGEAYDKLGDLPRARTSYIEALRMARHSGDLLTQADSLAELGGCADRIGDHGRAIRLLKEARKLDEIAGEREREARTYYGQALAERRLKRFEDAQRSIETALKILELLRQKPAQVQIRASFFAVRHAFWDFEIGLLMESARRERERRQEYEARAFEVSERARARSVLDELVARPGQGAVAAEPASPEPLELREIQQQVLDDDTLLLAYALGEKGSFLWLVGRDSIAVHELPPGKDLEKRAGAVHALLGSRQQTRSRVAGEQEARDLSRKLLGPVASELGGKRLLVVADGKLQYVPFAALPDPATGDGMKAAPLVAQHEVVSIPSASVLGALRRNLAARQLPPGIVAVFADPVFRADDPRLKGHTAPAEAVLPRHASPVAMASRSARDADLDRLGPLPFSGREAEAILALAPPERTFSAQGLAANRAAATSPTLGRYRFLHFATHGLIRDYPFMPGIMLSRFDEKGLPQDGFLSARDIYGLQLRADLVVLSACRTGLGEDLPGEGLAGLTRAFLHAGARRVLVSLWDVDDRATAQLMAFLYEEMLRRERSPAAALRIAQLRMMKETPWKAPYFWAGFVLQGDW
jgi:CHAT domain-containing protein/Tfp pilus assembly protein PilF